MGFFRFFFLFFRVFFLDSRHVSLPLNYGDDTHSCRDETVTVLNIISVIYFFRSQMGVFVLAGGESNVACKSAKIHI